MTDAAALAERALQLVRIASPIGQEKEIADHLEGWASRALPNRVRRVGHSLVVGALDDPKPMVVLLGHVDTVPAHRESPPAALEGGRLHGLGSADMKGALAVMMALAETLPAGPLNPVFVFYEKEEGPYLENGLGPVLEECPQLKRAAFGIAMEPTDNAVQAGCMGTLHATLSFHGQSAHSARPWQGKNAIHAAGPLLNELSQRVPLKVIAGGLEFREVMSVTTAQGGRARNVVPDLFELNLNYRFAPGKTVAQAQADVEALVAKRADVRFNDLSPSGRVASSNPHYQRLLSLSGKPAEAKQAWTDVGRLSEAGIDAVNFGPGEAAQAHQRLESSNVAALSVAYETLVRFLS
ncbi:MAG: succinyl-diaminopimelate desuccinylase [Myxococcaceae bacterium]